MPTVRGTVVKMWKKKSTRLGSTAYSGFATTNGRTGKEETKVGTWFCEMFTIGSRS